MREEDTSKYKEIEQRILCQSVTRQYEYSYPVPKRRIIRG